MNATALIAVLGLLACSFRLAAAEAPRHLDFKLESGKVHEECLRIESGASRRYEWTADALVDFNVHFHRGDEVFYPVKRVGKAKAGGTFTAKSSEDYCWMWTAKGPARIRGSIGK